MDERYSIPGAIVLAGLIIAGAIFFTRAPVRSVEREEEARSPSVAGAAEPSPTLSKVTLRSVDQSRDHIRGKEDAPITLVEYSDTECPFCKRFHSTAQQALQEYPGKVRWVYRHFPLDALHSKARKEAEATECAGEQGKFWEYVDRLFAVTPSNDGLDLAKLPEIARDAGLDVTAFSQCLESGKHAPRVAEDLQDATNAGGQGTPYTVILGPKGETIPFSGAQPYQNLKQVIEQLLAQQTS